MDTVRVPLVGRFGPTQKLETLRKTSRVSNNVIQWRRNVQIAVGGPYRNPVTDSKIYFITLGEFYVANQHIIERYRNERLNF